ncbi:MAG: hypothetical protein KJ077_10755 [Anaerolineae bacterium]|nr:hypothetical protein [Anaerolineae bacterium]
MRHDQLFTWLVTGREVLLRTELSVSIKDWSLEWAEGDDFCGWMVWNRKLDTEQYSLPEGQFPAAVNLFLEKALGLKPEEPGVFKYFFMLRPPSIATHPDGFIEYKRYEQRERHEATGRLVHGWVTYPQRLPFHQANHYDLLPDDLLERTVLGLYQVFSDGHDWYTTVVAISRYFDPGEYFQAKLAEGDYAATAILRLVEQGYTMADIEAFEELVHA